MKNEKSINNYQQRVEELEQENNSLRSKLDLINRLNYELRMPLGTIRNVYDFLHLLGLGDQEQEYVTYLGKESKHLVNLINDLILFHGLEAGKYTVENSLLRLDDCLSSVCDSFKELAALKGLEIKYSILDDVPETIISDEWKLEKIVRNLTENAVKFTEKGQVELLAFITQDQRDENGMSLTIAVQDTGIGIPENQLEKLHEFFSQAQPLIIPIETCFLGLAICKYLCEIIDGRIQVESKHNQGSKFSVTFPLRKPN